MASKRSTAKPHAPHRSAEDVHDVLEMDDESLLDVALSPELFNGHRIAALKAWLTDQNVEIPHTAMKKADIVAIVVDTLKEKQDFAREQSRAMLTESFENVLAMESEQLLNVHLSPEIFNNKECKISTLKAWLTEHDVEIPNTALKKADIVAVVLKTLKENQNIARERAAMEQRAAAKRSKQNKAVRVESKPIVPTRTPKKRPMPSIKANSSSKKTKQAEIKEEKLSPVSQQYSGPRVSTDLLYLLSKNEPQPVKSPSPSHSPASSHKPSSVEEIVLTKTPERNISEDNIFQRSSSNKSRKSRSVLLCRERPTAPDFSQDRSVSRPPHTPRKSLPGSFIRPSKLFTPVSKRNPRRVVQTVVVQNDPAMSRYKIPTVVAATLAAAMAAYILAAFVMSPPFCDSGFFPASDQDKCIPCPKHAECSHGRARCKKGLVLQNGLCVDDPQVLVLAEEMYQEIADVAARRHGEVLCGLREPESRAFDFDEAEKCIRPLFGSDARFEEAWSKARHRLVLSGGALKISVDGGIISLDSKKPLSCMAKEWVSQHSTTIVFLLCLLGLCVLALRRRRVGIRRQQQANEVFKAALLLLRDSNGAFALDHLYEHAFEECNLRKDAVVWDMVLNQLARDARISNAVTTVNGRQLKGMLFSHTPMKGPRRRTIHVYPSAQQ